MGEFSLIPVFHDCIADKSQVDLISSLLIWMAFDVKKRKNVFDICTSFNKFFIEYPEI